MESVSELPWPQCLGPFDEESCLFFLNEIGKRIVPFYPFQLGMEQVYGLILHRYGYDGATDVMSVLQELLEDNDIASGLGDDGDIWRSWRHGWKHRNDDTHNPFIPRVGCLILQPPTIPRIRHLKASNFLLLHGATKMGKESSFISGIVGGLSSSHEHHPTNSSTPLSLSQMRSLPVGLSNHRDATTWCSSWDTIQNATLHSMFCKESLYNLNTTPEGCHADIRSLGISSEKERRTSELQPWRINSLHLNLRGGEVPVESPQISLPLVTYHEKPFEQANASITEAYDISSPFSASKEITRSYEEVKEKVHASTNSAVQVQYQDSAVCDQQHPILPTLSELCEERLQQTAQQVPSPIADIPHKCNSPTYSSAGVISPGFDHQLRTQNRRARLVDGALLHIVTRKRKSLHQQDWPEAPGSTAALPTTPNSGTDLSRQSKHNRRSNWLFNIFSAIGADFPHREHQVHRKHYHFPSCTSSVSSFQQAGTPIASGKAANTSHMVTNSDNLHHFGTDGSMDASKSGAEIRSSLHSNKPLPPSPGDFRPSISVEAQRAFFNDSPDLSRISVTSSSRKSRNLEQDFIPSSLFVRGTSWNTASQHGSYGGHKQMEGNKSNDDVYFSPCGQRSPISFTSVANQNPFLADGSPSISIKPPPPTILSKHQVSSEEWPFRATEDNESLSQGDLVCMPTTMKEQEHAKILNDGSNNQPTTTEPSTRGRKSYATPSRHAHDKSRAIDSPSRSRSPIRRLFDIGKNTTSRSKTHENTLTLHSASISPNCSRNWSLKEWGNKIRYGFLTADQDQLHQEEALDRYRGNSVVRIVPPTYPNRSLFPVSLRPPDQSKVIADLELFISIAANSFLKREAHAGRITSESVAEVKTSWEANNKPQAIEFLFDIGTQRKLVVANLQTVDFCGDAAKDPIALCSTLQAWKIIVREISPRSLCNPDSVIRRWMHDTRRILEILGSGNGIMFSCDTLSLATYKAISDKERQRAQDRESQVSEKADPLHCRSASDGVHGLKKCDHRNESSASSRNRYVRPTRVPASNSFTSGMRPDKPETMLQNSTQTLANANNRIQSDEFGKIIRLGTSTTSSGLATSKAQLISPQDALLAAGHYPRFIIE